MPTGALRRGLVAVAWAVAAVAAVPPATAAEITWRASIWGPPRVSAQPFQWLVQEVAARTGGQLKVEITFDQTKATDAAELLKAGSAEVTYICTTYHADKLPLTTVIDLPMFAPDSVAALGRVELALGDHPAIQAELKKWNARMLLPVPLPQQQLMGTRRIARVDDFHGAKLRISRGMGGIFEEYGATINVISPTETVAALKSGTIDVVALAYPWAFTSFKIHEASRYITDKISLGTSLCFLGVSAKAWEALPARIQELILGLRRPAVDRYEALYAEEDAAAIAVFKQRGMEFVPFSAADRARLVAKAIKYWQAWVDEREKQDLKGREVFEFTQAKIREFTRR